MAERFCSSLCKFADVYSPRLDECVVRCSARGAEVSRFFFAHSDPSETAMNYRCIAQAKKAVSEKPKYLSDKKWEELKDRYYWPSEPYCGLDPFAV